MAKVELTSQEIKAADRLGASLATIAQTDAKLIVDTLLEHNMDTEQAIEEAVNFLWKQYTRRDGARRRQQKKSFTDKLRLILKPTEEVQHG